MSNSEYREAQQQAREHGLAKRQEQRLARATYTAAEVKVLTEAALRLGRKEAMEEFAATCGRRAQIAERVPEPMRSGVREGMVVTWLAAQRLAEDAAYLAAPDASEPRTDPSMGMDLPPEPQAVREPRSDPPGPGVGHRRCDCWRGHPIDICAECGEDWPCEEAP